MLYWENSMRQIKGQVYSDVIYRTVQLKMFVQCDLREHISLFVYCRLIKSVRNRVLYPVKAGVCHGAG